MKFIGNIFIYVGLFIIYQFSGLAGGGGFDFGGLFVGLLSSSPLLAIGAWLVNIHEQEEQKKAEDNAKETIAEIHATGSGDCSLYLRPFDSTNAYRLSDAHLNLFNWELWERDGFDDIERMVARALRPTVNLIALGRPGEHRGAARVLTSEEEWRGEVAALAKAARLIVVIPASNQGTLWEIAHIKELGYYKKTIFIMPPADGLFYVSNGVNVPNDWEITRRACEQLGVTLPAHIGAGALFTLNSHYAMKSILPLPVPNPTQWMKSIQKLIDDF